MQAIPIFSQVSEFVFSRSFSPIFVTGKDTEKYLQGLMTQDIAKISDPQFARVLFPKSNGKIVFDAYLQKETAGCRLWIPAEFSEISLKYLDFFHVQEELEILLEEPSVLYFRFFTQEFTEKSGLFVSSLNRLIVSQNTPVGGSGMIWQSSDEKEYDGIRPLFSYFEIRDLPNSYPAEMRLEQAVSYTKGCYIGQEPIARMQFKGKAMKQVRTFYSASPLKIGETILNGKEKAGSVLLSSLISCKENHSSLVLLKTRYTGPEFADSFLTPNREKIYLENVAKTKTDSL